MNKKILTLVIFIALIAIIGGIIFAVTSSNNKTGIGVEEKGENETIISNKTNDENQSSQVNNNENENNNANTNTESEGKTLIVYFTQSGNTEKVAKIIEQEIDADLIKLETVKTYKSDYNDLLDEAQEEKSSNARPELKTKLNIDNYDTIIIGMPIWWGDMPMPIYTFLDNYDLSGKKVAAFVTHGGSGLCNVPNKIKSEEPNAIITEGLAISGSSAGNSQSKVKDWLSNIGID